ncbi:MAG TPA: M28 family metallopeptidase [Pontiella sp.]
MIQLNPILPRYAFLLLISISLIVGCQSEQTQIADFNGQRAFEEVEALVQISPRNAGTPEGLRAAQHIFQRLKDFGVEADIETFTDMTPEGEKEFRNVIGRIPGKNDQWIILGSHYDTMPGIQNFQGANDSGSSTGVLIELARILSLRQDLRTTMRQPETGIVLAFFDGEEGIAGYIPGDGLHGSRYMARQLKRSGEDKNVKAMILLDMVGDKDLHFSLPLNSSQSLVKEVLKAAHATGYRGYFSLSPNSVITDDHVPFLEIGIPAIDIIDFSFGSKPGSNDHWHTNQDSLENITAESLEITGSITLQLLKQMAFNLETDK